jgi:YNFM family putative membrane transporter
MGASVVGTLGGVFMRYFGWHGVVALTCALVLLGLFLSWRLSRIEPLPAA